MVWYGNEELRFILICFSLNTAINKLMTLSQQGISKTCNSLPFKTETSITPIWTFTTPHTSLHLHHTMQSTSFWRAHNRMEKISSAGVYDEYLRKPNKPLIFTEQQATRVVISSLHFERQLQARDHPQNSLSDLRIRRLLSTNDIVHKSDEHTVVQKFFICRESKLADRVNGL
jgi:hypothetical protein